MTARFGVTAAPYWSHAGDTDRNCAILVTFPTLGIFVPARHCDTVVAETPAATAKAC